MTVIIRREWPHVKRFWSLFSAFALSQLCQSPHAILSRTAHGALSPDGRAAISCRHLLNIMHRRFLFALDAVRFHHPHGLLFPRWCIRLKLLDLLDGFLS